MNFKNNLIILSLFTFFTSVFAIEMNNDEIGSNNIQMLEIIRAQIDEVRALSLAPDIDEISRKRINSYLEQLEEKLLDLEISLGMNELYNSIKEEKLENVKKIVEGGAKIFEKHLVKAISTNNDLIIKLLLKHIDQAVITKYLCDLIEKGDISNLEVLLIKGVDPNILRRYFILSGVLSCKGNSFDVYRMLRKHGLRDEKREIFCKTICGSGSNNKKEVETFFNELVLKELSNNTIVKLYGSSPEIADRLFKQGYDIDMINEKGNTPLIEAAAGSRLKSVIFLVEHGADLYIKNKEGRNALAEAKFFKTRHAVRIRDFNVVKINGVPLSNLNRIIEYLECQNPAFSACEAQKKLKQSTVERVLQATPLIPGIAEIVSGYLYDQPQEKEAAEQ